MSVNEVTISLHYVIITRVCIAAWMLKNNELKTAAAPREARCDVLYNILSLLVRNNNNNRLQLIFNTIIKAKVVFFIFIIILATQTRLRLLYLIVTL